MSSSFLMTVGCSTTRWPTGQEAFGIDARLPAGRLRDHTAVLTQALVLVLAQPSVLLLAQPSVLVQPSVLWLVQALVLWSV